MHIALLGGSFNPAHNGHISVARQIVEFAFADEIWFLPNYGQSPPKDVAAVADRLAMTRLLHVPKTRVSTIEIDNKLDGETIHLLPFLPREHTFSFVIGSDQLAGFTKWLGWEQLLKSMQFLVFPRAGHPNEPLYERMKVVNDKRLVLSSISSTQIRERVQNGLPIDALVPPAVARYIVDYRLYREPPLAPLPVGRIQ
jgi:nicotinate-nucleotide adenylyltransferase